MFIGASMREPLTSESSLDCHFTSINDRKWTSILTSSCATQTFSIISKLYHIWLLDRQCHGKHMTKFSWILTWLCVWLYYVIIVSWKHTKFYWMTIANMAIWSPVVWKLCNTTFVKLQGMYGYIAWGLNNYIA